MRDLAMYLSMIPVALFGAALMFDIKGVRARFTRKAGESDEYVRRFQIPAMLVGGVFFFFPVAAIVHSFFR